MTGQYSLSILMAGAPIKSFQVQLLQSLHRVEVVQKNPEKLYPRHLSQNEASLFPDWHKHKKTEDYQ
jgi:hypothetical protein